MTPGNQSFNSHSSSHAAVIFLVDDEPRVLSAVADTLRSIGCTVRAFSTGESCLQAIKGESCDLLISDVNMPEMDGIKLLRQTKALRPLLPVLMISGYGDIPMAVRAVKEGACDFLEKPLNEETFLPKVKQLLSEASHSASVDAGSLTPAEKRILQLVAEGKTNKEIAQLLDRSLRTVENHRHRLMNKLNAESVADLVKIALAMGVVSSGGGHVLNLPAS